MKITDSVAAFAAFSLLCAGAVSPTFADTFTLTSDPNVTNAVVISYDPADGNLSVQGNGVELTTIEMISASSMFDADKVTEGLITPPFDVATSAKIFHLDTAGFGSLNLGPVAAMGMTGADLISDIEINGSILPSGDLPSAPGGGPYLYVAAQIPEPSSLILFGIGLLLAIKRRR